MSEDNEQNGIDEESGAVDQPPEAAASEAAPSAATPGDDEAYVPEPMDAQPAATPAAEVNLDLVLSVPVDVTLEVGRTSVTIQELVNLVEGSIVALDRDATDPMDVLVNGTLVARGEIVVVNERFGVRLTDIVSPSDRVAGLN